MFRRFAAACLLAIAATAHAQLIPATPADCLFNWAEENFPSFFAPAGATSNTLEPYYYRHYPQTNAYLGTSSADNHVYYIGPLSNHSILDLGALSPLLSMAGCHATYSMTISTSGTGSGTVAVNPSGPSYASGTVVTLTATPNTGSTFAGWSGACSGMATTCTVTMEANRSVTATFNLVLTTYTLSIVTSGTGSGSITANSTGPTYVSGTVVSLTATPNTGSTFAGWSGACSGTATTCNVTMDANQSVTATFNLIATSYTLSIVTSGTGSGSVTANPPGPTYAGGTVVTLTATPNAASTFAGWSGDCSGTSSTCTVTMNLTKSVTATFSVIAAPTIVSLSTNSVVPFQQLTVTGMGLTQGTSAVSVRFIPQNGDPALTVPVSAPSSTSLQVMVPPLFDPTTGGSISGLVDVQVIQVLDTTLMTSNLIRGLQIAASIPVPTGTPVGSRTAAFLNTASDVFSRTQSSLSGNPTWLLITGAAPNYNSSLSSLLSAINAIKTNPNTLVPFITANGSTVILDADTLVRSDQMIQALVAELASKTQVPTTLAKPDTNRNGFSPMSFAQVSSPCPIYPNDPIAYDTNLCYFRRAFDNLTQNSVFLPALGKFLGAALVGEYAAAAILADQIIAGAAFTLASSLVITGNPPPGGDLVEGMAFTTLDDWAKKGGLIGYAYELSKLFREAAAAYPSRQGAAPVAMAVSDPAGNTYLLLRDGSKLVTVPTTQGSVPIDSLTLVSQNSPWEGHYVGRWRETCPDSEFGGSLTWDIAADGSMSGSLELNGSYAGILGMVSTSGYLVVTQDLGNAAIWSGRFTGSGTSRRGSGRFSNPYCPGYWSIP